MNLASELSKYVNADILADIAPITVTIRAIVKEVVGMGENASEKFVLYFGDDFPFDKGIVLNATNAKTLIALHGPETDNYKGKKLRLEVQPVSYLGKIVKGIRFGRAD